MIQALVSFIIYLVIQVAIFFIGFNVMKKEDKLRYSDIIQTYVIGQMTVFALIQILAVPMILLRLKFNILYYSFMTIAIVLLVLGINKFVKNGIPKISSFKGYIKTLTPVTIIFLIISALMILAQFLIYFFGQHLDEDDARWMAEANDALVYGDMMTRNFATGEYVGRFIMAKDITSPWPMMWAILARTLHVRTSIAIHTVYASFEMIVMYMIYYLITRELFEKKDSRFTFLIMVAVINLFYAGTTFTQSVFSMVRIWQGKATVAAVIIPLIIYIFIKINKENRLGDWLRLPIVTCGACLLSGMGVSISAIMVGVYGAYNIIAYKNWKRIPLWLLSIVPGAIFSLIYFFFKG